ncbi:hypothetical protein SUDANB5_00561 [Streptomyces sp. SudanB5_2050]
MRMAERTARAVRLPAAARAWPMAHDPWPVAGSGLA